MTMTRVIPPEAEGTISTTPDGRAVLRFERHLRHSVDRVWAAVSQPAKMEAWLAFKARLEPEVGGRLSLWLGDSRSDSPVSDGEVTVFDPPHVLQAQMTDGSVLRFEVSATFWDDAAQTERPALVVPLLRAGGESADSALLGFYQTSNWELLVKVLDGCAVNDHYWVFAAAATDLGWRVRVRDRVTDTRFHAEQVLGLPQPPTTDTQALPVCDPMGDVP